jgi:nitrite reductase (NO-forming)
MTEQRISNRARLMAIPAIGAVAVGVAAFSRGGFAQDSTATPEASPSPSASPMATPATEAAGGAAATEVTVKAGDLFFDPKELTIAAGTDVKVTLENGGALAHDWAVRDHDGVATQLLNPGQSETINVNLPAGEYTYYCTVPGHADAGMVGKLIVQ